MALAKILKFSKRRCLIFACGNAILSLATLLMDDNFRSIRPFAFVSFAIYLILLMNKSDNILFFARTLLLGGLGYFPMVVKVLFGQDALFATVERSTQGFDVVSLMYVATSLALLGNEIGLWLGERGGPLPRKSWHPEERSLWRSIFILSIPAVLASSFGAIHALGPPVFVAAYATENQKSIVGVVVATGVICLLAMWVSFLKLRRKYHLQIFWALAFFFLIYSVLIRGGRLDVLSAFLGLTVCYSLVKGGAFRVDFRGLLAIAAIFLLFSIWGIARGEIATYGFDWGRFVAAYVSEIFGNSGAIKTVSVGTVSEIALTFSNMVWLIKSGNLHYIWGRSYWEFIPRTPPEFLYPGRPADYAWIFEQYNLGATGGFFELAEAYMNLGLVGALIVPAVISYLLSRSFFNVLRKQTALSYFLLFTFLAVFFRGSWYQTFAFYKCFITALCVYFIFYLIHISIFKKSGFT